MGVNEKAWGIGFKRLIGDPSLGNGETYGICVDNTTKQLHILDIDDWDTDWNLSVDSHPAVYIHSTTTPETNYIKMYHDGSSGIIDVADTTVFTLTSSSIATALPLSLTYTAGAALTITQATLDADVRAVRFLFTAATPAMTDGYGPFEVELTVTGTATAGIAATSTWINLGTDAVVPEYMTIHNDGIWDGTATLTNALVSMHKYQCALASNPQWLSIFELNFSQNSNNVIDAMFNVNQATRALGLVEATPTGAATGSIPFFSQAGGGPVKWIRTYDDATT